MSQTLLRLRPYQRETVDRIHDAHWSGMQRPAVVLPTGTGKTICFCHLAAEHIQATGERVMILVHRDELADQTLDKLRHIAPDLKTGKVKASDNEITAQVMVCSVQTLARPSRLQQLRDAEAYAGPVSLMIVDECHHAVADSYRNIMETMGCFELSDGHPCMAVGFTATLARGDGRGLGDVWEDVVFQRSVLWAIAEGHLTDVRARRIDVQDLDLSSVRRSGGDYSAKSLGDALMEAGGPEIIFQTVKEHAADRRSVIVFCPTVDMAEATAAHIRNASGLTAAVVHGGTPREDRLLIYKAFRTGDLRVLVNCMVLTEGADFPYADCAVIARPTRSDTLFIQMVGRVLRPSPATGKTDALVITLGDGTGALRTLVDLSPDVYGVEDDETLTEAYEREQARREERVPARSLRFALKHRDLDLFKASPAYQWLRTAGGVQFIPLGGAGEILLWPSQEAEEWDVVHAPEDNYRRGPWVRLHTGLALSMAMAWGESEADERSLLNTGKNASWRKKKASEGQLRYATRLLGREPDENLRAGEVGDLISTAVASRNIDRYLPREK